MDITDRLLALTSRLASVIPKINSPDQLTQMEVNLCSFVEDLEKLYPDHPRNALRETMQYVCALLNTEEKVCDHVSTTFAAFGEHLKTTNHAQYVRYAEDLSDEEVARLQRYRDKKYYCGKYRFDGSRCNYGADRRDAVTRHAKYIPHLDYFKIRGTVCVLCMVCVRQDEMIQHLNGSCCLKRNHVVRLIQ